MYIPEKNKEKFYNSVSNLSPRQFELQLRQQYKESEQYINESTSTVNSPGKNSFYPTPIPKADKTIPAIPIN